MKKTLRLVLALVLTVAVLATGLIFANAADVADGAALKAAVEAGGEINITEDFSWDVQIDITNSVTINGNGHTLTGRLLFGGEGEINLNNVNLVGPNGSGDIYRVSGNPKVTISGGSMTTSGTGSGDAALWLMGDTGENAVVTLKDGVAINTTAASNMCINISSDAKGKLIIEDAAMVSAKYGMRLQGATEVKFLGGSLTVNGTPSAIEMKDTATTNLVIGNNGNGPTITNTSVAENPLIVLTSNAATAHTIYGGTFAVNAEVDMFSIAKEATLTVAGGTFNVDPTTYVTDPNCTIAKDGENWVVTPAPKEPEIWEAFDYETWEEAINNFEDGDTINITGEIVDNLEYREISGKKVTFTGTGSVIFASDDAETGLWFVDGSEGVFNGPSFTTLKKQEKDQLIKIESQDGNSKAVVTINTGSFTGQIYVGKNSSLTINDGTFCNVNTYASTKDTIRYGASSGTLDINGGKFTVTGQGGDTAAIFFANVSNYNVSVENATFCVDSAGNKNTYAFYLDGGTGSSETNSLNIKNCDFEVIGKGRAIHIRKNIIGTVTVEDSTFTHDGDNSLFATWMGDSKPAGTFILKNSTVTHTGTGNILVAGDFAHTIYVDGCNFTAVNTAVVLQNYPVTMVAQGAPSTFTSLTSQAITVAEKATFTDNGLVTLNNEAGRFTITFDAQGATNPATATTELTGKLAELPVVSKVGYTFNGWFDAATGGNEVTVDTVFLAPTTIYAQWTACDHKASTEQPNCKNGATCTVCGFEMPAGQHNNVWKFDANQHWQECDGCGTVAGEKANHTGGTATCSNKAVCSEANCAQAYGELDAANHESTEFTYIENEDGTTHTKKNACCGAVVAADEAHEFGDDNICDYCEYTKGYKVTEGDAQNVEEGKDATFKIDADFSKFTNAVVKVDGTVVDAENYTAVEGSIVITLKASYLDTLDAGNHTLEVTLADGAAVNSTFTTVKAGGTGNEGGNTEQKPAPNPGTQTGDFTNITLLFVLAMISGLGMTALTVRAKKRA